MIGNPRREFALAFLLCALAAGAVLFAASHVWLVEWVERPAPLGPQRVEQSGANLVPALPAMGLVVLAGAGSLFATRGRLRRAVGLLVVISGVAATALAASSLGRTGVSLVWPSLALLGGLVATAGGALTMWRAAGWPGMGGRYERPSREVPVNGVTHVDASMRGREPEQKSRPPGPVERGHELWDALDRGEDPTR